MAESVPDSKLLAEIERVACDWTRQAGERIVAQFRTQIAIEFKQENRRDPVTAADRASEVFLKEAIADRFPSHGILGEEGAETAVESADYLWVLDPLDGTTNFAYGLPFFGVSVGILYRRRPVIGCIYLPTTPHLTSGAYHARIGGGAWFEDVRLTLPRLAEADSAGISGLPGSFRGLFRVTGHPRVGIGDQRSLGSIAYEIAMVADGALQSAFFARPKIWDVAAGATLVREAGGSVLIFRRNAWYSLDRFDLPNSRRRDWLDLLLPAPSPRTPPPTGLRGWASPVVFGPIGVAEFYARHVRARPLGPVFALLRVRNRIRERRKRRKPTEPADATPPAGGKRTVQDEPANR